MTDQRAPGRRYSMETHGQSSTGFAGDYVLKPSSSVKKWTPPYGGGKVMTARFLPVRNPDNPSQWESLMIPGSTHEPQWGDWIRLYQVARMGAGDASVSFITHDPAQGGFDPLNSPPWVLYQAVNRRVSAKSDPGWGGYLKGAEGRGAELQRPGGVYFTQVWIVQSKDGFHVPPIGFADDGVLNVLQYSSAVGNSILKQVQTPRQGYNGDPNDFVNSLMYGDIVSLDQGAYVTFYTKSDGDPRIRQQQQTAASWSAAAANATTASKEIGFEAFLSPSFNGIPASLREYEGKIAAKTKSWDQLLNFPDVVQQAHWLADRFPPDMIVFAFEARPEWVPEGIRQKAVARNQVGYGGPVTAPWMAPQPDMNPYQQLNPPIGWQPPAAIGQQQAWGQVAAPLATNAPAPAQQAWGQAPLPSLTNTQTPGMMPGTTGPSWGQVGSQSLPGMPPTTITGQIGAMPLNHGQQPQMQPQAATQQTWQPQPGGNVAPGPQTYGQPPQTFSQQPQGSWGPQAAVTQPAAAQQFAPQPQQFAQQPQQGSWGPAAGVAASPPADVSQQYQQPPTAGYVAPQQFGQPGQQLPQSAPQQFQMPAQAAPQQFQMPAQQPPAGLAGFGVPPAMATPEQVAAQVAAMRAAAGR